LWEIYPTDQERIFETFNRHGVNYLLIGGMNMLLLPEKDQKQDRIRLLKQVLQLP
jgi:hypothetical protein